MSNINYSANKKAIDAFRKELVSMMEDIREIDKNVLNNAVNDAVEYAQDKSPRITGNFADNWGSTPATRDKDGSVTATLFNGADYAEYVNYGHRSVDKDKKTTGYVKSAKGDHLLERSVIFAGKQLEEEFRREVEAVQKRHDK